MIEFSTDNLDLMDTLLTLSWRRETSYDPNNWSESNPSLGQCAVTCLILQDCFGGQIIKHRVTLPDGTITTHYSNEFAPNIQHDITGKQFPLGTKIYRTNQGEIPIREYLLSNPDTVERYKKLKEIVMVYYKQFLSSNDLTTIE